MTHEADSSRVVADSKHAAVNVFSEDNQSSRTYRFDQVFDQTCRQSEVYRGLGVG